MPGQVWFVGAGPGDPELITVKGRALLEKAGAILFAGSLVDVAATRYARADCVIRDSKDMTLEEMSAWLLAAVAHHATVVRLQTGDPGLYGALIEMTRPLTAAGIGWAVVPGVSSAMAAMAAAGETLTLPEVTQTVILTRVAGRTPMPAGEDLAALASHHTTLCIYLSITLLREVQRALRAAGWAEHAPVLMDAGLDHAAAATPAGARVIVLPFILNTAGHVKDDIPGAVAAARQRHPDTDFVCAPPLGLGREILTVVERRLDDSLRALAVPDPRTTGIVLLGRGSSDSEANSEMAKLARWVYEAREHDLVDIAFTGITHPRLELVVQRQVRLGMTQIVVQPVYLFAGVLIERIEAQLARLEKTYPQISFAHGSYFGFDDEMFELLEKRTIQARDGKAPLRLLCDGCLYRQAHGFAPVHAHHVIPPCDGHTHDPAHA